MPPEFNLTSSADWQPVGPAQTIAELQPNRPVIASWDFTVPAAATTHSSLIGVVSSEDDPITTTETDADALHRNEKRVCLKNLHVINAPGPRPTAQLVTLDFHDTRDKVDVIDIFLQPDNFSEGVIGMLAPKLSFRDPKTALHGVTVVQLRKNEFVGDWYVKPGDKICKVSHDALWKQLDLTRLYEFDSEKVSELRGIRIAAKDKLRAVFTLRGLKNVPYGQHQRFAVTQRQSGRIVGGSTFEFRVRRAKAMHPVSRIRVILEKVKILDDNDICILGAGEFHFDVCVAFNDDTYRRHFRRLPHKGFYRISDCEGHNEKVIDACIFDGFVAEEDNMTIALLPVEEDLLSPDDELSRYRRVFNGPPETWVGAYAPDDQGQGDPEAKEDWYVWYRIESMPF